MRIVEVFADPFHQDSSYLLAQCLLRVRMERWKEELLRSAADVELKWKLATAIEDLLGKDWALLTTDGNERAITHRLGIYLEPLFPTWNVDCEYNREGEEPKRNSSGELVLPDVIVHRRGTNQNLLVIELKKAASLQAAEEEKKKLREYRTTQGYDYAVFINLRISAAERTVELDWIHAEEQRI